MSIKIKTFVLCKRVGTDLGEPEVFPSFELAYKTMEAQYTAALSEYDEGSYYKDESSIGGETATIVTSSDWEEWIITEKELEISDLHGFASVFREHLGVFSAQFEQFILRMPKAMETADSLLEELNSLKKLLSAASGGTLSGQGNYV